MGRVADHDISNFADGLGAVVPCFVYIVCIRRNRVDFNTQVFQRSVLILQILKLGWADESEIRRVEAENAPFSFQISLGHLDEFSVVVSLCFKGQDFFSNQ
ncbi:hypothetical protein D1872_299460 [compost metagenome]